MPERFHRRFLIAVKSIQILVGNSVLKVFSNPQPFLHCSTGDQATLWSGERATPSQPNPAPLRRLSADPGAYFWSANLSIFEHFAVEKQLGPRFRALSARRYLCKRTAMTGETQQITESSSFPGQAIEARKLSNHHFQGN